MTKRSNSCRQPRFSKNMQKKFYTESGEKSSMLENTEEAEEFWR